MRELLEKIMRGQASFPAAQRLVAAYVLNNCYQIPFLSITALAKNIGVSDSTIIKFCAQLGLDGYGEFKKLFSEYVHSELVMYNKIASSTESGTPSHSVFSEVMNEDIADIQATLSDDVNAESLKKLLAMIKKANNIYTLGSRSSMFFGEYLAMLLRCLGLRVHTISGGMDDYLDRASVIDFDDLIIAFCFPRYTALTVRILKDLHERGIPVALITDTGLSPAYPYADVAFRCTASCNVYFPCYTSCMSLINVICRAASIHFKETALSHVHCLEKQLLEWGIFI